ncbi:sigma-54 interaction domain-containing protein [Alkalicoccus urumqiensis]|uniref:Sigma-54-dependent Fis family transcriptional regulator n=1 Tax=Alkalicoccus urumqiensis TaxID=1548213 RepID=A0A2P6MKD3_ALKUR|nr:sigma-54-dependent Fis family transcriptional regulator [Alkalicoccus urumqiensis]PRO66721.1 sigma-54-dependent Fis family transcriptional regulator [Alkalicoccus urumqiensis]
MEKKPLISIPRETWESFIGEDIFTDREQSFITSADTADVKFRASAADDTCGREAASMIVRQAARCLELGEENERLAGVIEATRDGMIAVDAEGRVTLLNARAREMTGLKASECLGAPIEKVMPTSRLPRVLETGKAEYHQRQELSKTRTIITTRVPLMEKGRLIGALGVFQDITELEELAEEVTSLKSIRKMLEAIIYSSEEAISVVDENGRGLMINPAYTRLTGLKEEDVLGKPAAVDISEGESIHMKVLREAEPVRGARMRVGPAKKEVLVNVAPVIVDGEVKGSVGVIHDISNLEYLASELEIARSIIRKLEAAYEFTDIIGSSPQMAMAKDQAKVAARTPATILLRGESGTGKELFAHAIHNESSRRFRPFIRVNCAALPEQLLESELFGYEEGAFSGARRGGKKGLFEEADGGSIFLDEIGEMSSSVQAKLLRVLQEREIVRVGGSRPVPVDVRIIAATNAPVEGNIEAGSFRADLFYRLNRMPIFIPSLRERPEDIQPLSDHLIKKLNQEYGRVINGLTKEALAALEEYAWPGNVRELENVISRAMIHLPPAAKNITFEVLHLDREDVPGPVIIPASGGDSLAEIVEEAEKHALYTALRDNNGNKTQTAKQLEISIRSLYYKLEKYGIH